MVLVLENAEAGWAVMGTGTIATENMVTAIRSIGHRVLWVVSQDKRDAAVFAQDLKIPKFTTDLNRVLRDPAVASSMSAPGLLIGLITFLRLHEPTSTSYATDR
jgi:hypothetical protein